MTSERKSALILGGIAAIECGWVALNLQLSGWRFVRYLGFAPGLSGDLAGWIVAGLVTAIFVAFALRLPPVRANLFRPSLLKLLAIAVAVGAGILEEVVFRRWTMNWLMALGYGLSHVTCHSSLASSPSRLKRESRRGPETAGRPGGFSSNSLDYLYPIPSASSVGSSITAVATIPWSD
jgi:hypothetical protein